MSLEWLRYQSETEPDGRNPRSCNSSYLALDMKQHTRNASYFTTLDRIASFVTI